MHERPVAPRENIAHLSHSLEMALGRNRTLLEDMARFTREESLRLARLQLDHAGTAFAQLQDRHDFGGLIDAQQEWIKQTMQEYATLGLRYAEMFQGLTQQVQSHVQATASDLQNQAAEGVEGLERNLEKGMPYTQTGQHGGHAAMPAQ